MNLKTNSNEALQAQNVTLEHPVENIILILSLITTGYFLSLETFI
jgi:hypothetical protein